MTLNEFLYRNNIPIALLKQVWGSRHGIRGWQIEEAAQSYYNDVIAGRTPMPEPIDAGWAIMRRAKALKIRKMGEKHAQIESLRSEIDMLKEELAFEKLPWHQKLRWRTYRR